MPANCIQDSVVKYQVDNSLSNRTISQLVRTWGINYPSLAASIAVPVITTVGDNVTFNNFDEAVAVLGTDSSLGNYAIKAIKLIYDYNPRSIVTYTYPGPQVTAFTGSLDGGGSEIDPASLVINVQAGEGASFAPGDRVFIDTGVTEEPNEVASVLVDAITLKFPTSFNHADGAAINIVAPITEVDYTTARDAIIDKKFDFFLEYAFTDTQYADVKAWSDSRFTTDCIKSRYGFGPNFDTTCDDFSVSMKTINDELLIPIYGLPVSIRDGRESQVFNTVIEDGNLLVAHVFARYAAFISSYALRDRAVLEAMGMVVETLVDVIRADNYETIKEKYAAGLLCKNLSAVFPQVINFTNTIAVERLITSYNENALAIPDESRTSIGPINIEFRLQDYFETAVFNFLVTQNTIKFNPVTTDNLEILDGFVKSLILNFADFNRNVTTGGMNPEETLVRTYDSLDRSVKYEFQYVNNQGIYRVFIFGAPIFFDQGLPQTITV